MGAVRTFHSGFTVEMSTYRYNSDDPKRKKDRPLGAPLDLDAVKLTTSSLKKMSNEMLGMVERSDRSIMAYYAC